MYMGCLERLYICRQETTGHLYGKGDGKVHYNRRQNKGWSGVSRIKKLDSYPTPEKGGVMCLYLGRDICDSENKNGNGLLQLGWEVCTLEKLSIFVL